MQNQKQLIIDYLSINTKFLTYIKNRNISVWRVCDPFKNKWAFAKNIITTMLFFITLLPSNISATKLEQDKKNVLVVDSYHQGYSWSDGIFKGIKSVYDNLENINLLVEHLDTKRYADSLYYKLKEEEFNYKYANMNVDVIILNDDNAFDFILGIRNRLFKDVSIVFAGVDHLDMELVSNTKDIYGLTGGQSIKGTIELILSVHPKIENIVFVSDGTTAGISMVKTVRDLEPNYKDKVAFHYFTSMSTEDLLLALQKLPEESIVFSLVYIRDSNGKMYTLRESIKMISEVVDVPVYSAWGIEPDMGCLGGKISRGYECGKLMAELGYRVLMNDRVDRIPQLQDEPSVCVYDYKVMNRFGLSQSDIPPQSIIYNLPVSVYGKYKIEIWSVIVFILLLSFSVIFLLVTNLKRKRAEYALQNAHRLLEQKVADRTMQLSEANKELFAEITERRKNEKLFINIFELSPYPLFIADLNGAIIDINQSFTSVFGYEKKEVVGKTTLDLKLWIIESQREIIRKQLIRDKRVKNKEVKFYLKSGEVIDTQFSASLIEIYDETIILSEIIDVTARKKAEQSLKENEEKLRESVATKDKFFSIIAHDLRSPFNGILGISKILEKDHKILDDEQREMMIRMLNDSVKSTFNLLENLLSWSRAQSQTLSFNPEKLYLKLLVYDTISDFQAAAEQKNIKISENVTDDIVVFADKNMFKAVLRNLVSNAIKFSNQDGRIIIESVKHAYFMEISVKDEGVGIPQGKIDDLFRIEKDTSTLGTKNEKGTGLGLILCKEFVEKHGGKIWVDSIIGKGSAFHFTIPLKEIKSDVKFK